MISLFLQQKLIFRFDKLLNECLVLVLLFAIFFVWRAFQILLQLEFGIHFSDHVNEYFILASEGIVLFQHLLVLRLILLKFSRAHLLLSLRHRLLLTPQITLASCILNFKQNCWKLENLFWTWSRQFLTIQPFTCFKVKAKFQVIIQLDLGLVVIKTELLGPLVCIHFQSW